MDISVKKAAIPCVEGLVEEFDNRSGDCESVLVYREGHRRQSQEFRQEPVIGTALNPHTKWLCGIWAHEHKVWDIVSRWAAEIAAAIIRGREGATASSPTSGFGPAFLRERTSESRRPRTGFMAAPTANVRSTLATLSLRSSSDFVLERALFNMCRFSGFQGNLPGPVQVVGKAHELPPLARRVLVTPVSQAQSECLFNECLRHNHKKWNSLGMNNI